MPASTVSGRAAFTLIELLVVMAVVAVLIALLLPAMSRAREMGNRVICQSNQRQLAIAAWHYSNDFHGEFPTYGYYIGTQLTPYLEGQPTYRAEIFICPSARNKPVVTWDGDANAPYGGLYYSDAGSAYGYNCHMLGTSPTFLRSINVGMLYWWASPPNATDPPYPRMTLDEVSMPSQVWWTVDATSIRFDFITWYGGAFLSGYRHGGNVDLADWELKPGAEGFNASMMDCHAQWVDWKDWLAWRASGWSHLDPFAWY